MPSHNSKSTLDFLGTIGSADRGDGVTLNHTATALVELADFLMTTARENADRAGGVATGGIVSSMTAKDIEINGSKMELDIELDSAYKFTDKGVKGTESGSSKAGFAFKNNFVSKKMALAILKWLRNRGNRGRIKYKAYTSKPQGSRNEKRNKKIFKTIQKADDLKSLAYATATSIKKKGIKGTEWFSKAIKATEKEKKKMFSEAFKVDIIETLNN